MASEREAGVDRIIAFSDGVVAIAITLLVLPLTEIEPPQGGTLVDVVVENQGALFAFALSFAVIANYWNIHHVMLTPLRRHSPGFVLINMMWLAAIVFLPFPTSLIEDGLDGGFGTLYIIALLVVSMLSLLIAAYLARHPELTDNKAVPESRRHVISGGFSVGALLLAVIISFFSPTGGVWALFLLFPAQIIAGRVVEKGQRSILTEQ